MSQEFKFPFPSLAPSRVLVLALAVAFTLSVPVLRVSAGDVEGLALPFKSVTVSSPVQEIIAELMVEEGDTVKEGDVVARLRDDREKIDLRRYEKVLEKRQFDYEASQSLLKDEVGSKEEALSDEAELELAKVDVELAKTELEEKTILAPLDGIVVKKWLEAGESVDRVEPLFEIVNVEQLYLQFFLEPRFVKDLKEGTVIEFTVVDEPETVYSAEIDFISPGADASSGLFRVKLLFDNAGERIKAGLRVTGKFPD